MYINISRTKYVFHISEESSQWKTFSSKMPTSILLAFIGPAKPFSMCTILGYAV